MSFEQPWLEPSFQEHTQTSHENRTHSHFTHKLWETKEPKCHLLIRPLVTTRPTDFFPLVTRTRSLTTMSIYTWPVPLSAPKCGPVVKKISRTLEKCNKRIARTPIAAFEPNQTREDCSARVSDAGPPQVFHPIFSALGAACETQKKENSQPLIGRFNTQNTSRRLCHHLPPTLWAQLTPSAQAHHAPTLRVAPAQNILGPTCPDFLDSGFPQQFGHKFA